MSKTACINLWQLYQHTQNLEQADCDFAHVHDIVLIVILMLKEENIF